MDFMTSIDTRYLHKGIRILLIVVITKILVSRISPKSRFFKNLQKKKKISSALARYITRIIRIIIYVLATYLLVTELGFNVTGLVAGFGISGVVIALAAQDFGKSFIAGLTVLADKSFNIGDWIKIGDCEGAIETIGLNNVTIRNIDDSVAIIPNTVLVSNKVINLSKHEKRRYDFNINIPTNTSRKDIEKLMIKIKTNIELEQDTLKDSAKIFWPEFKDDYLVIKGYITSTYTKLEDFLAYKTRINLRIKKILEEEKIELAYPGKNIYLK